MMKCQDASHLLSQSMDRRLPWSQRVGLRLHLAMCRACSQFARQLVLLRQAVVAFGRQVENDVGIRLSEDARHRISDALHQRRIEAKQHPDQS